MLRFPLRCGITCRHRTIFNTIATNFPDCAANFRYMRCISLTAHHSFPSEIVAIVIVVRHVVRRALGTILDYWILAKLLQDPARVRISSEHQRMILIMENLERRFQMCSAIRVHVMTRTDFATSPRNRHLGNRNQRNVLFSDTTSRCHVAMNCL